MSMTEAELNEQAALRAELLRLVYFGNLSKKTMNRMLKVFEEPPRDSESSPEMSDREFAVVMKRVAEYFTDDELAVMRMDRWGRRIEPWPSE